MSNADRSGPRRSRPTIPPASAPRHSFPEEPTLPVPPNTSTPPAPDLQNLVAEAARRADVALQQRTRIRSARAQAEALVARARTWLHDLTRQLFEQSQHSATSSHAEATHHARAQVTQARQQQELAAAHVATGQERVARTRSLANRVRAVINGLRAQPTTLVSDDAVRLKHSVAVARNHRSWIDEQIAGARRQVQRCRSVAASITSLLVLSRQRSESCTAAIAANERVVVDLQKRVQETQMIAIHAQAPVLKTKDRIEQQQVTAILLKEAIDGIGKAGFGSYLSRASGAVRVLINTVHAEAQSDGAKNAGRPPGPGTDGNSHQRAKRAAEAQARRCTPVPIDTSTKDIASSRADQVPKTPAGSTEALDPAVSGSRPTHRNHDAAIENLPAEQALRYLERLHESRRIGYAAAVRDATAGTLSAGGRDIIYRPAHQPFELKNGACLIAVRGGDAVEFALSMDTSPTALEDWLGEPAIRRNLMIGGKARLKNVAGQIIAAWSPELHDAAARGELDIALAHQVDQLIARFGLHGHRVAAYLHTDSESGHPHLHVNFARVRDSDLSLWSLEGRQRATALWLHGRSNTARLRGADALADDVDALGATSPAARGAELLMSSDNLSATRTLVTGHSEHLSLQGSEAAQRVTAVGQYHHALGGGILKFGLGENPADIRKWKTEVRQATQAGNEQRLAALRSDKPKVRGYWLEAIKSGEGRYELRYREGYGHYVARKSAARRRKSA